MTALAPALATFLDGIMAGVVLGSALVEQSARALPANGWIGYKQAKERLFGPVMPPILIAAIAASAAAAIRLPAHAAFAAAALFLILLLIITALVHAPLNRAIGTFSSSAPPDGWTRTRDRWRRWNWARAMAAGAAFASAVIGAVR